MHELELTIRELIKEFMKNTSAGWLWLFGWLSHYLYLVSKWEKFRLWIFLINWFLAFWLSMVVWDFVPVWAAYRDWIMWLTGFSTFPILALVEKKFPEWIFKKITK